MQAAVRNSKVTCPFCQALTDADLHRCERCGRRFTAHEPVGTGLQLIKGGSERPAPTREPVVQASLFGPQAVPAATPEPAKPNGVRAPRRPRCPSSSQTSFDFDGGRALPNAVESALFCNAPVALSAHRALAAALDTGLGAIALMLFFLTLQLVGGAATLAAALSLPVYCTVAVLFQIFYRLLFCLANADTPGMRWCGLRLVSFHGRPLTSRQRVFRLAAALVSLVAAGLGILWALVDEERLAWHDYMSRSFPTPDLDG